MVDEVITPAAPAASAQASAPVAEPVVSSPAAPPVAAAPDISAKVPELAPTVLGAEPIKPVVEPVKADEPVVTPEPAKIPEPVKPAEGEKTPEAKKDEGDKSVEPAPLPVFEPWVLPEGVKLDEKDSGEFNKLLGEFQTTSKAEQALVQKFGQTLVDKHTAAVTETVNRVHKAYTDSWVKQTEDWKQAFVSDPEIGGKRQETTVRQANEFISTHGGSPEQQAEFRSLMQHTGLGNHPAMIRIFAKAMERFGEPKPVPANAPVGAVSKTSKWYGKKSG